MHAVDRQFKCRLFVWLTKLNDSCEDVSFHFRVRKWFLVEFARVLGQNDCIVPMHFGDRKVVFLSFLELLQVLQQSLHELGANLLQADHISVGLLDYFEDGWVSIVRVILFEPNIVSEKCYMCWLSKYLWHHSNAQSIACRPLLTLNLQLTRNQILLPALNSLAFRSCRACPLRSEWQRVILVYFVVHS